MKSCIHPIYSLFALVLSVAVLPGCDHDEDLGLSLAELDAMSAEDLDALAEELDETDVRDAALDTVWQPQQTHGAPSTLDIVGVPPPPPTHGGTLLASDVLIGEAPGGCDPNDDELELNSR